TYGWTKDGRYFVYQNGGSGDMDGEPPHFVALDSRTGRSQEIAGSELEDAAMAAFLKKNPLASGGKEVKSNPQSKAEVVPGASDEGGWTDSEWSSGSSTWELRVNGKRAAVCSAGASIRVFFSPDGKRTVWIVSHPGTSMRDVGSDD